MYEISVSECTNFLMKLTDLQFYNLSSYSLINQMYDKKMCHESSTPMRMVIFTKPGKTRFKNKTF